MVFADMHKKSGRQKQIRHHRGEGRKGDPAVKDPYEQKHPGRIDHNTSRRQEAEEPRFPDGLQHHHQQQFQHNTKAPAEGYSHVPHLFTIKIAF